MKCDFHIHSKYSYDGVLEPAKIVKIAVKKGLDGIAITDHDTIKGGLRTKKYETKDFKVIIGSEVSTERGEIIGLFLSEEIESRVAKEVMHEIKVQNGIVVIPHPFDKMRSSTFHPTKDYIRFIDNIEVFNSRCVFQKYNTKAAKFAEKYGLSKIAGSDAHFVNEIGNAGIITEKENIRESIVKNDFEVFGKRSCIINHAFTKALKLWRKSYG